VDGVLNFDSGSGDIALRDFKSDVVAGTGSGDVSVEASGDVSREFDDATAVMERRKVEGYRRGDLRVKIDADTGSGDVSVGPGRS
jgi:DUF4097 and DUF4098 domain-containing protein YvlB